MVRVLTAVVVLLVAAPPAAGVSPRWGWPVRGPVVHAFHTRASPFVAGQHRGIDIAAAVGAPVRSACPGLVAFAGYAGSSGRTVSVRCGPFTATYLHLSSIAVRRGAGLDAGDLVGSVGTSGRPRFSTAHLHFGVRWTARRWGYVDPLSLLGGPAGGGGPALLPTPRHLPGPLGPAPRAVARAPHAAPRRLSARVAAPVGAAPAAVPLAAWVGLGLLAAAAPTGLLRRRSARRARRALSAAPRARGARPGCGV